MTTGLIPEREMRTLSRFAEVYRSDEMDGKAIESLLPEVDSLLVFSWPSFLTGEKLYSMRRLRFIQSVLVGVNHIPFESLPRRVIVCSNAGAFSLEVGEHAWALVLAAAKKIVAHSRRISHGESEMSGFAGEADDIQVLKGKTLGVLGYGGIGRQVARFGSAFGMRVIAFARKDAPDPWVRVYRGRGGLDSVLKQSDVIVIALPLTRRTEKVIGERELSEMRSTSVLVNVARGDLVDQHALYSHLVLNLSFRYATDVWWYNEGKETLMTGNQLIKLPNFVGTPHMSGPTGLATGNPARRAAENTLRFLKGQRPQNVVKRSEYQAE